LTDAGDETDKAL